MSVDLASLVEEQPEDDPEFNPYNEAGKARGVWADVHHAPQGGDKRKNESKQPQAAKKQKRDPKNGGARKTKRRRRTRKSKRRRRTRKSKRRRRK